MFIKLRACFWNWIAIQCLKICRIFGINIDVKSALLEKVGEQYNGDTVINVAKFYMQNKVITFNDYCDIVRECKMK